MSKSNSSQSVADNLITIDRRRGDRRNAGADEAARPATNAPRPKKPRRRHIDPTTCERDYSEDEIEFMRAMDEYKRDAGRMFPTCSEVLEVIRALGYHKLNDDQIARLGLELLDPAVADSSIDSELCDLDDDFADE
jgi:hypothetical protein